jgi:hypothetical protein
MRDAKPAVTEPSGSPENLERFSLLGYDPHKIEHMHHDNSILAYEMNGKSTGAQWGPAPRAAA